MRIQLYLFVPIKTDPINCSLLEFSEKGSSKFHCLLLHICCVLWNKNNFKVIYARNITGYWSIVRPMWRSCIRSDYLQVIKISTPLRMSCNHLRHNSCAILPYRGKFFLLKGKKQRKYNSRISEKTVFILLQNLLFSLVTVVMCNFMYIHLIFC